MSDRQPAMPVITLSMHDAAPPARDDGLRAALEASGIGTWSWDVAEDRIEWDATVARLFGLPPGRTPRRLAEFLALVHPDDRERVAESCEGRLDGAPVTFEYRTILPDGGVRWLYTRAAMLAAGAGRPGRLAGAIIDVTARKATEAALAESEERLRLATEVTGIGTWDVDPVAGIRRWSNEFKAIVGMAADDPADYDLFARLLHPDDHDWVCERYAAAFDPANGGRYGLECRIHRLNDGALRWLAIDGRVLFDDSGRPLRGVGTVVDITGRKCAEEALRVRTAELETVLQTVPAGVWVAHDPEGARITANPVGMGMLRLPPDVEPSARNPRPHRFFRDGVEVPVPDLPMHRAARGEAVVDDELEVRFPDGDTTVLLVNAAPLRAAGGPPAGAVGAALDITGRKRAEEHQKLLMAELNHRVKNTLATVQSIAGQTLRNAGSSEAFTEAFTGRLLALSGAHDLLTEGAWQGASLAEVVRRTLAPYAAEEGRVTVSGPPVRLSPNAAVTLNMAFHELATNAAKYGALSVPQGCVTVSWDWLESGLDIRWSERGGPPVAPPARRGFGSRLIERGIGQELDAEVRLDFAPQGAQCRMRIPVSHKVTVR